MSFEKEENEFLLEYKKTQERLDSLYWKKHSNWYLKFKKYDDEKFKKIDKYLGFYFISNYGQVVSFQNKAPLLRRYSFINGFFGVNLSMFGQSKFYFIHELVFSHFVGEIKSNRPVIHINGIVTDNFYKNLRLSRVSDSVRKKKKFDFSLEDPNFDAGTQNIEPVKHNAHTRARPILQFDLQGKWV
ncbi:HNH endonuclease, partial [Acidobacteriota bacterium]